MRIKTDFKQITKLKNLIGKKIIRVEYLQKEHEEIILFFEKEFASKREYCVIRAYGYEQGDNYIELSEDDYYDEVRAGNYKKLHKSGMITQEEFDIVSQHFQKIEQAEKEKKDKKEYERLSKLYGT
jgi:hypothetical protein